MTVGTGALLTFEHTFVRELAGLYEPWPPAPVPSPRLLVHNAALAAQLGIDADALSAPAAVAALAGNAVPDGAQPVAQAYSGHQFGGYVPRLGDGRALLLGEIVDVDGRRRDLHLKGSGRTPYARGGDGRAAIGPMLREYVIGEAMHALGVPTSRGLAVVATGQRVRREAGELPGAVLARVADSHLRVGTFEYAARRGDPALLRRLADYAIARHHPQAAEADNRYLGLLDALVGVQASLVAQWMLLGFVHGVMNTDNMTISGQTIDYGPCAFMEAHDPATVFSSIDHGGRYAYGNQPGIAGWNLARFAETLLSLIDDDIEAAKVAAAATLESFPRRYRDRWTEGMGHKLGLTGGEAGTAQTAAQVETLGEQLLGLLRADAVDHTSALRALSGYLRGHTDRARSLFTDTDAFDAWARRWRAALDAHGRHPGTAADAMDAVNPVYIPRNHLVERALDAATGGDLQPLHRLLTAVTQPFAEAPGLADHAVPAPPEFGRYRTFCGT